jgi:hypothetical protein
MLAVGRAQATARERVMDHPGKMAESLPLTELAGGNHLRRFPFVILLLFFTHGVGTLTALKSYLVALI